MKKLLILLIKNFYAKPRLNIAKNLEKDDLFYDYNIFHDFDGLKASGIWEWAEKMSKMQENDIERFVIGKTWENRDIIVLKLNDKLSHSHIPSKQIAIDCGMHAQEWISPAVCQFLVAELIDPKSEFSYMRYGIEWHIFPVLNPDGYQYSHDHFRYWRKNRNPNLKRQQKDIESNKKKRKHNCGYENGIGVDLNRNYDIQFKAGKLSMVGASNDCKSTTYKGLSAFSEPESRSHSSYISKLMPDAYLTMHSYGKIVLFPYTYAKNAESPDNYDELMQLSAEITSKMNPGWIFGQGRDIFHYHSAGGSDDWARSIGIPLSFCFELNSEKLEFDVPENQISLIAIETIKGITAVADKLITQRNDE